MFETIAHRIDDGILTITLNRPDNLNAFVVTMGDELERSFRDVNDNDDVRAVIVTGAGRAFCAGMDLGGDGNVFGLDESRSPGLADLADLDDPNIARVRDPGGKLTLTIHDCRKPVIAAINGAAVGVGATMTLAMDRRLISTQGRIGLIFGRIGVTPEAASSWFLERIVGQSAALDLVLRADIIDAAAAAAVGLVDEVVEPDALLSRAIEVADADAHVLGLNAVSDGLNVVYPAAAAGFAAQLAAAGFRPIGVDLSELLKGGGSVKCCTLEVYSTSC